MAHHHHHHEGDGYFLDQICLIALAGAFAAVCLTLFFWNRKMLEMMLAPQFYAYILLSGGALLVLVLVRAAGVWRMAGADAHGQVHDPDHSHHHHDCHEHDHCGHEHAHDPEHGEGNAHDHGHAWTPMKCVVLLIPIIFYLMGLPTRPPSGRDASEVDVTGDAANYAMIVASGFESLPQTIVAAAVFDEGAGETVLPIRFQALESLAYKENDRAAWGGKWVLVRGQFVPSPDSPHRFTLMRQKIQCCGADVIQLNVPILAKQPVTGFVSDQWVSVKGKVEFRERRQGGFTTVLQVPRSSYIQPTQPDPTLYLQN